MTVYAPGGQSSGERPDCLQILARLAMGERKELGCEASRCEASHQPLPIEGGDIVVRHHGIALPEGIFGERIANVIEASRFDEKRVAAFAQFDSQGRHGICPFWKKKGDAA
jgi:hypothetical protein